MALYTTYFHLRAKNSAGTVQATFSPLATNGRKVEAGDGEPVVEERELLTYATSNYFVGYKQIVKATFQAEASKVIPGLASGTGSHSLEAVLNALPAGGYLEYQIDNASVGAGTWVPCELVRVSRKKFGNNKNVGIETSIELISRALVSSPFAVS
jgi:hypothetical protein